MSQRVTKRKTCNDEKGYNNQSHTAKKQQKQQQQQQQQAPSPVSSIRCPPGPVPLPRSLQGTYHQGKHVDIYTMSRNEASNAPAVYPPDDVQEEEEEECEEEEEGPSCPLASDLLTAILYPIPPDVFMKHIWKHRALHIKLPEPSSSVGKKGKGKCEEEEKDVREELGPRRMERAIRNHLNGLDLDYMLENTASPNIHVWVKPQPKQQTITTKQHARTISPPSSSPGGMIRLNSFELDASNPSTIHAANILYQGGASLYFRSPQMMANAFIADVSRQVGLDFAGLENDGDVKGEIEIFCSRSGHVTDWHWDFQQNFTLQLQGSKRWKFRTSSIPFDPLRGATPHYNTDKNVEEQQMKINQLADPQFNWKNKPNGDESDIEEIVVHAGECFYFPAGMWHRVECEEDSISANLSLVSVDWASLLLDGVKQHVWKQDKFRAQLSINSPGQAREYVKDLLHNLRQEINHMQPEDFLPPSIFLPRRTLVTITSLACTSSSYSSSLSSSSLSYRSHLDEQLLPSPMRDLRDLFAMGRDEEKVCFRPNPLAVLIKFEHGLGQEEEEGEEEEKHEEEAEEEEEEEDDEEEEAPTSKQNGKKQKQGKGRKQKDEEEDSSDSPPAVATSDDEPDDGEPKVGYVVHHQFGSDGMESRIRVCLDVSQSITHVVEAVKSCAVKGINFSLRQVLMAAGYQENTSTTISSSSSSKSSKKSDKSASPQPLPIPLAARKVLMVLAQQGYIHYVQQ